MDPFSEAKKDTSLEGGALDRKPKRRDTSESELIAVAVIPNAEPFATLTSGWATLK